MVKFELEHVGKHIVLQVDMAQVRRETFGVLDWRRRFATWLIRLAARVLRIGVQFEGAPQ